MAISQTGLPGLDAVVDGLKAGDNVVWRVDDLEEYRLFCRALARSAAGLASPDVPPAVAYFRFAQHPPLFTPEEQEQWGIADLELPLNQGFEHFITTVHRYIVGYGEHAVLIFDSLSDLSQRYFSDRMIGNFFQLTCPLILRTGSVAYFSLERFFHSYHTVEPITETTQVLMDVFRHHETTYVQPVKLDRRDATGAFTLFRWDSPEHFAPVTASGEIVPVLNTRPWPGLRSASYRMVGVWDRAFLDAETRLREVEAGRVPRAAAAEEKEKLLELIVSREERILELAREHLTLADVVAIWKRMIGTGHIGGKSVGMLLANAILNRTGTEWRRILEDHDSFFVGSDVYYTFLVINDCWWDRQRQKDPDRGLRDNEGVRQRILEGVFPEYILDRFSDMLDYFGTSPIIVRSSSLLEDNFGNAFAGKYESVFCTMQGSREERLEEFLAAVRVIYASTISDAALEYRKKRGILEQDEQMGLLVQRVSGDRHRHGRLGGRWFFPHLAGVAFSYNPWAWHRSIDPAAGLVRLVFGLGTRAVDRADDDYTRVVALNAPDRRPDGSPEEVRRHSQRRVDVLDLGREQLRSVYFVDLLKEDLRLPLPLIAERDRELLRDHRVPSNLSWILTFDGILTRTPLVSDLRELLARLRATYRSEVDVEFTVNIDPAAATAADAPSDDASAARPYRITVVQCRPLQVHGEDVTEVVVPPDDRDRTVLACGAVIGHSRRLAVTRIVFVRPAAFAALPEQRRRELAAVIRRITAVPAEGTVLLGPGRWGTSTPALGIPVQVRDIGDTRVLVELDRIHDNLVADLSLGTHFFNEMVEEDLLYLAYRETESEDQFRPDILEAFPNTIVDTGVDHHRWEPVIHLVRFDRSAPAELVASSESQRAVLSVPPPGSEVR